MASIEVSAPYKEAGGIQTFEGMFDIDESWTEQLPPGPPNVPDDLPRVLEQIADWEGDQGKYSLYEKLGRLKASIEDSRRVYAVMQKLAKEKIEIPDRALRLYKSVIEHIKMSNNQIMGQADYCGLGVFARAKRKLLIAWRQS